jgi:hypothetical protein
MGGGWCGDETDDTGGYHSLLFVIYEFILLVTILVWNPNLTQPIDPVQNDPIGVNFENDIFSKKIKISNFGFRIRIYLNAIECSKF